MKYLILFILVLLQNIVLFGQENISVDESKFCEELVKYRDEELLSDFLKVSDNYRINYQAKIDIEKIKNDLLDDNKWQMSAAGNAFGQLMSLTKSTCILILELLPASKSIKLELEAHKIYRLYTYGKKAKSFVTKDFEQFLFDEGIKKMLGDLNPVMTITQEILNTANNMDNLDKDWKGYKETVQNQIINLDKSIKNYEAAVIKYENDFERINKYKNFIDKYLSENCSSKPETDDEKFNFKGTTVWKDVVESKDNPYRYYAIINRFLYEVVEGGNPDDIKWFSDGPDAGKYFCYHKIAPDIYESYYSTRYITFLNKDKLVEKEYDKGKKLKAESYATRIGTLSENSLPTASNETISTKNATGSWNYESMYDPKKRLTTLNLFSDNDNKISIKKYGYDKYPEFLYEKVSANVFEHKLKNVGTAKLVFLSPTRIYLSYVYKNYVSFGYYNKIAVPIVKQETKPAPVTENKTVATNCDISGKWHTGEMNIPYTGDYLIQVECLGDNINIKFTLDPSSTNSGRLISETATARRSSTYVIGYNDVKDAIVWEGACPFNGVNNARGVWIYWPDKKALLYNMKEINTTYWFFREKNSYGF